MSLFGDLGKRFNGLFVRPGPDLDDEYGLGEGHSFEYGMFARDLQGEVVPYGGQGKDRRDGFVLRSPPVQSEEAVCAFLGHLGSLYNGRLDRISYAVAGFISHCTGELLARGEVRLFIRVDGGKAYLRRTNRQSARSSLFEDEILEEVTTDIGLPSIWPPSRYRSVWRSCLRTLANVSDQSAAFVIGGNQPGMPPVPFDYVDYRRTLVGVVGEATRPFGWRAGHVWENQNGFHTVYRYLRYELLKAELREHFVRCLNGILAKWLQEGCEVLMVADVLPSAALVSAAIQENDRGLASFADLIDRFKVY